MHFYLTNKYLTSNYLEYIIQKCPTQTRIETQIQIEECLRYLFLAHFTSGPIPVNQKIDNIWHLLILQTIEYANLCKKLPSKKFIHHSSEIFNQLENKKHINENFEYETKRQLEWLVNYQEHFGPMTEENIQYWSFAWALCQKLHLNTTQFANEIKKL